MSSFGKFHPIVLFVYYAEVLLFSMFFIHPLVLIPSLLGAVIFYGLLVRRDVLFRDMGYYFLLFLLFTFTNPLFSHNGETILFYLNDQAITFEAIVYGAMVATMIVSVIFWCKCCQLVMTTDKFLYLFGKAIPKLSLLLSMTLRYIPLYKQQVKKVREAQKCMGLYQKQSLWEKLLGGLRIFDSVFGWAVENAVDTADSMAARGYGRKNRTNFILFRFRSRDVILLLVLWSALILFVIGYQKGWLSFHYYPVITKMSLEGKNIGQAVLIMLFMLIPTGIESEGKIVWNYLRSKI